VSLVVEQARSAFSAGLMPLPVMPDGSKRPAVAEWGRFKTHRATKDEMRAWRWEQQLGFGVIAGPVSGHTESWDFDNLATFDAFCETGRATGLGDLIDRLLAGYCDATPRDGRRILVRYPTDVEWQDVTLAKRNGANGKPETLIELPTFAIVAPSAGGVHPSGKPYRRLSGDFTTIAGYTREERDALIRLARSFDETPVRDVRREPASASGGSRPGDAFGAATSWPEILEPHGWRPVYSRGDVTFWRRPDKAIGISATTNHAGSGLLYVFSSSTPFAPERSYTKFAAYAVLEHGSDYSSAARALAARGFGEPRPVGRNGVRPAGIADVQGDSGPIITRLSDVRPEPIDWLWTGRLALGKKTLIAGDPGLGKSWLTLDIAARITSGSAWPDGGPVVPGDVLFMCAGDGLADTVRPRIDALGGNPARVFVLEGVTDSNGRRLVNLARDLSALEQAIGSVAPRLVVIDPITAYLGRTDSYKDSEVRGLLAPILAMLEKHRCALLTVAHLSKDQQRAALHRPGGSIAFVAAARLAFALAADPNDDTRRILAVLKTNICVPAPSLAFRLPDGRLEWERGHVAIDVEMLLRPAPSNHEREEQIDGESFLREFLADGPQFSADILKAAESNGISRSTLFRIKSRLGIRATRVGGVGAAGRWTWTLSVPEAAAKALVQDPGTLSTLSTLRPITVPSISKSTNGLALEVDDCERY